MGHLGRNDRGSMWLYNVNRTFRTRLTPWRPRPARIHGSASRPGHTRIRLTNQELDETKARHKHAQVGDVRGQPITGSSPRGVIDWAASRPPISCRYAPRS